MEAASPTRIDDFIRGIQLLGRMTLLCKAGVCSASGVPPDESESVPFKRLELRHGFANHTGYSCYLHFCLSSLSCMQKLLHANNTGLTPMQVLIKSMVLRALLTWKRLQRSRIVSGRGLDLQMDSKMHIVSSRSYLTSQPKTMWTSRKHNGKESHRLASRIQCEMLSCARKYPR